MKRMKKLAAALLALGCVFAVGGLTACKDKAETPVAVVQIDKTAITMKLGETKQIVASFEGEGTATYTSSKTDVATVDEEGNVTATGVGEAIITVTVGESSKTCKITVINVAVSDVFFRYDDVKLAVGTTKALDAIVSPLIATNKNVTYVSSNTSVATVDADGVVKGLAVGETTITVKTADGEKTATCKVTVGNAVEAITLKVNGEEVTELPAFRATKTAKIDAVIAPLDAIIQDVIWTSSNESVASVADGEVYGIGVGTATITATTVDGNKKATCKVTIEEFIRVESVTFVEEVEEQEVALSDRVNLIKGDGINLNAKVTPANAMEPGLKWMSSNPTVATVNENGEVVTHQAGKAKIVAMNENQRMMRDEVELNVIEGGTMFYNDYYTPNGSYTFKVFGAEEFKLNGTALAEGDYTYENEMFTITAETILSKGVSGVNALNFISAENKNVDVPMNVALAQATTFAAGELGTEIFAKDASILSSTVENGRAIFNMKEGTTANLAYNLEYLEAMFAYPNLESITIKIVSTENITGTPTIRLMNKNGTWYNDVKGSNDNISIPLSRIAYYKMKKDGGAYLTSNSGVNLSGVSANAVIIVDSVRATLNNAAESYGNVVGSYSNTIFADKPQDGKLTLELSSYATELTKMNLGGDWDADAYQLDGNKIIFNQEQINVYNRNGVRLWIESAYGKEFFRLCTSLTPATSQTFAAGGTFEFTRPEGTLDYKVISITVNGRDISEVEGVSIVMDEEDETGALGVKFENAGNYRLQVRVEKTCPDVNTRFICASYDIYDRQITVTENA